MPIEKVKELVLPIVSDLNVKLYDVVWTKAGRNKVLQVSIMNDDGTIDIETCAEVSERLSKVLDDENIIDFEYFLEVCSPGVERVLRNENDIQEAVGKHVYVKFKHLINNKLMEVTGDLMDFTENELLVTYYDKAVKKKVTFNIEDIELIRLAVKF